MGDAICSQISPSMYVQYAKDLHREIIDFIHSQGALVKVHICGNITKLLPHLRELQPDNKSQFWKEQEHGEAQRTNRDTRRKTGGGQETPQNLSMNLRITL